MKLPGCLALALTLCVVLSVSAQTHDPKLSARVSEANLTRAQREVGDAMWKGMAMPIMRNPKVDPVSLDQVGDLIGDFRWSGDDANSITLSLFPSGAWKMVVIDVGVQAEPEGGRWIVRKDHIELWEKGFGGKTADNNALHAGLFLKKGRLYFFKEDAKGGSVELRRPQPVKNRRTTPAPGQQKPWISAPVSGSQTPAAPARP